MKKRTRATRFIFPAFCLVVSTSHGAPLDPSWEPSHAVEYVVPAGAGAALDTAARVVKGALESRKIVKQPIVVTNKVGGGGALMTAYLDDRVGDGHVIATIAPTLLTSRITGQLKKTYSDFTPIAVLFNDYVVLSVRADSGIRDLRGLIARLKGGDSLSLGVAAALGNHVHIGAALAVKAAGIDPKCSMPLRTSRPPNR
jgi:putative tricarboxylic transport membrane protein